MNKIVLLMLVLLTNSIMAAPVLPDKNLTPGEVYTSDALIACAAHTGRESDSIRRVTYEVSQYVYSKYNLKDNHSGYCSEDKKGCELDHLIPLKLGGKNSVRNLWPQSYGGIDGAFKKDALEKTLIARVCRTSIKHPVALDIRTAQQAIANNWLEAYQKYVVQQQ